MKKLLIAFIVLGVAVFAIPNAANAVPLINGSVSLVAGSHWTADIFYQVYAPNQADAPGIGAVNYYSYFYRVDNVVSAEGDTLKHLTVGNLSKAPIVTVNYTDYNSGRDPVGYGDLVDSIVWDWAITSPVTLNVINPGEHSDWCYYTTPREPGWVDGSLQNGGAAIFGRVPGPTPEPCSMAMLGLGLVGLVSRKLRKKFMA